MVPTVVSMVAFLALAAGGCSSSSTGPDAAIEGHWEWVKSEGGLLPMDRTPATEGYTRALAFDGTGRVRLFQDGAPIGETTYRVTIGDANSGLTGVPVIQYGEPLLGFPEQAYQFPSRDTLILQDGCCDGFTYTFVRTDAP